MVAKPQDWYEDRAQDLWEAALTLADGNESDAIEIIKTLDLDAFKADREKP